MMKTCTNTIFNKTTRKVADAVIEVVDEFREYWPLTVRQVYYRLVGKLIIKNTPESYRQVSRVLVKLREHELVKWHAIVDNTRRTTPKRGMNNVSEFVSEALDGLKPEYYGRCYVQGQRVYCEISTEKDALASIISSEIWIYCTRLNIVRGQASATMVEKMAGRFDAAIMRGQRPVLLHFGDLDPSGIAIPKAIKRNMASRHGVDVDVRQVALTPEQVNEYKLLTSPDAVKDKDPNYNTWVAEFGKRQAAVELDALHPATLKEIIKDELHQVYDIDNMIEEQQKEYEDRRLIGEIHNSISLMVHEVFPEVFN